MNDPHRQVSWLAAHHMDIAFPNDFSDGLGAGPKHMPYSPLTVAGTAPDQAMPYRVPILSPKGHRCEYCKVLTLCCRLFTRRVRKNNDEFTDAPPH
jgi:hypothetical protein